MKPRTKVPASLLRDLRLYAYYDSGSKLSRDLLSFTVETSRPDWNTPMYLAEKLVGFSRRIARGERLGCNGARARIGDNTVGSDEDPKNAAHRVAADVVQNAECMAERALLQARIWRVVQGLMVAAQDGRPPATGYTGATWFRPAEGLHG